MRALLEDPDDSPVRILRRLPYLARMVAPMNLQRLDDSSPAPALCCRCGAIRGAALMAVDREGPTWAVFCRSDLPYQDGCEPTDQAAADEVYRQFRIDPYLWPRGLTLTRPPYQR